MIFSQDIIIIIISDIIQFSSSDRLRCVDGQTLFFPYHDQFCAKLVPRYVMRSEFNFGVELVLTRNISNWTGSCYDASSGLVRGR